VGAWRRKALRLRAGMMLVGDGYGRGLWLSEMRGGADADDASDAHGPPAFFTTPSICSKASLKLARLCTDISCVSFSPQLHLIPPSRLALDGLSMSFGVSFADRLYLVQPEQLRMQRR